MNDTDLDAFQIALGYRFKDVTNLERALVHASADVEHNERLEFLGDGALGYAVSAALYQCMPHQSVGDLAERKATLVSNKRLVQLAVELGIDRLIRLGGSIANDRFQPRKIYADALEAVVGAIALDGGLGAVRSFVDKHIYPHASDAIDFERHAKTKLQEWADAAGFDAPDYTVVKQETDRVGELWYVKCTVTNLSHSGEGVARTKREAERFAAEAILAKVDEK
ncbi:MAG: ribonuclease III [Gammaproteobacteria bacterium]|nr:ribonuclease III [Gammaproteobacteria bacterium]